MIVIKPGDFDGFFEAPFNAYPADSLYVSPMRGDLARFVGRDDNPLFRGDSEIQIFTAYRDDRPVGRITAHVHAESNAKFGTREAYFGYFDCEDHPDTARALLEAAEGWARERGFTSIVGNHNLTAMQQMGVVTEGFEHAPFTDLHYNPPHIPVLLEANGYAPEFPMTTFQTLVPDDPLSVPPRIGPKQQAILDDPGFAFAPISRTVADRIEDARIILNASFVDNPGFVPVTKAEYDFQSRDMKWIIDPRISAVLHHRGRPAACILCIPDLNPLIKASRSRMGPMFPVRFLAHRMRRRRAVLIYSGVIPELQGRGVNPLVLNRVMRGLSGAGYEVLGNTWVGDGNPASLRQKEKMGATPLHRLALFRKDLA